MWGNEILTATDLNAEFNNIINNASSLISPLGGSLDWDGYAHTLDAAGVTTAQSTSSVAWAFTPGSKSGTPSTTGGVSNWVASTWTDSATAGSGTATAWAGHAFQRPTLAASNATVTTTNAATVYVANSPLAGSNETLTNAWALWVDDGHVRYDGDAHIQQDLVATINKFSVTASVAANALTIALKDRDGNDASASTPITFKFRSTTGGTGTYTLGSVTGALSTTISSGSTLGTVSGVINRLHIGVLLTGSTVELCYWNAYTAGSGVFGFYDDALISTTAEGGAGAADSAWVMYSTTARASVPWVYLGYVESTQGTAGTWATSPSKVQTAYDGMPKPGDVVRHVFTESGAVATGTTTVPFDDTIPQSGEGTQFYSIAYTPRSAANLLRIQSVLHGENSNGGYLTTALFQDATADALAAGVIYSGAGGQMYQASLTYHMLAGITSSTTFKLRAGSNVAGTLTVNGTASGRQYGGAVYSGITIWELHA